MHINQYELASVDDEPDAPEPMSLGGIVFGVALGLLAWAIVGALIFCAYLQLRGGRP
jgi:hypothetical protein